MKKNPSLEFLSGEVADFLNSNNFPSSSEQGAEIHQTYWFNIHVPNHDKQPRKYLWGLITLPPKPTFHLGALWIRNSGEPWLFEIYELDHSSIAMELGKKIALRFKVRISLCLLKGPVKAVGTQSYAYLTTISGI